MSASKQLLIFIVAFSLVSLPGVLSKDSNHRILAPPMIRQNIDQWFPAGPQEQTLSISEGNGVNGVQVGWLLTNQVDAEDWPLTATQYGSGSGNVNCPGSTTVFCSFPVPDHGYFEIQFNLAGVFWGIPMEYGVNPAGVQLRQGIAHLINKTSIVANNPGCAGIVCVANDNPIPLCSTMYCTNGGLVDPNPCGWDSLFPENSSVNCVVGASGGIAYNCTYSATCPSGTITGTTEFSGQVAIGSPDFCAAAQHFIHAFSDAGITGVTTNANCELVPPSGGWPSVVTSVTTQGDCFGGSTANLCFGVRSTEPRHSLGEGLAQEICALFSPAWGAWTTLAGKPVSCDNSNTGSGNVACGGGSCPFLQEVEPLDAFCGFTTSTNGVPLNCWGMLTGGFGQVFPFDSTTYFEYNSVFATKTTVTCNNADCSSNTSGSTCASTLSTNSPSDYMYLCSPTYDSLTSAMEFSTCLASPGPVTDPIFNQATPTFASCSGSTVSGGAGATTCTSTSPICTAVSAGYQAMDYFGSHVFTIPVWSGLDIQARLNNWQDGFNAFNSPGAVTAFGGGYSASANLWTWLNAYSPNPAVPATFRQSLLTTVDSLNPFDFTTLWDGYLLSNIYDTLFNQNPQCTNSPGLASSFGEPQCTSIFQDIDWMTTSHRFVCYPGGPPCSQTNLGYGNATYFANTTADLRLSLNRVNHWQEGGPVTAWDVKYSFINLNATGAFQATALANVSHINVIDEFTLDVNLKTLGPFTEFAMGGITIIPGHTWSACGVTNWNGAISGKNIAGTSVVNAAEDNCVGSFGAPSIATVGGVRADSPTFSVLGNKFLIGSGPYSCQSIGGTGHPAMGTIGGGCSVDNTDAPPSNLNVFTLTRTGCNLTSSGTMCGVAGSSNDYFRSTGTLASYIWTGDIGSGSSDFSKVLTVNSCHSATPSANCPHWAQGIGNPGGTNNPVGLSQRLKVNSFKGMSWITFSTEKTMGSQLILSCIAGYTLPGTTITPCNSTNEGWTPLILPGIGSYAPVLYEVGSQITIGTTTTSTSTLSPASVVGCTTNYPAGGYDC